MLVTFQVTTFDIIHTPAYRIRPHTHTRTMIKQSYGYLKKKKKLIIFYIRYCLARRESTTWKGQRQVTRCSSTHHPPTDNDSTSRRRLQLLLQSGASWTYDAITNATFIHEKLD